MPAKKQAESPQAEELFETFLRNDSPLVRKSANREFSPTHSDVRLPFGIYSSCPRDGIVSSERSTATRTSWLRVLTPVLSNNC
jgi:hypothetical protein